MNKKNIILFCSLFILLIPLNNVKAFTFIDYINNGNYAFFLFDMDIGNNTIISVTHDDSGNFTLFLFNRRPSESYVKGDKSLDSRIFSNPSLVASDVSDNPYINYTATEYKIYYIEILLAGGGPDTYNLTCNLSLTRYYLPIIPGYQLEFFLISLISTMAIILLALRKKVSKK